MGPIITELIKRTFEVVEPEALTEDLNFLVAVFIEMVTTPYP